MQVIHSPAVQTLSARSQRKVMLLMLVVREMGSRAWSILLGMGLVGLSPGLLLLQGTWYSRLWPEQPCVPRVGCSGEEI